MRKKPVMILSIIVSIVVLGIAWLYLFYAAPSIELHQQLSEIVHTHDKKMIQSLSLDTSTEQFILNTSSKAKITTSDFQGGGKVKDWYEIGYYPATVDNKYLGCYMVLDTRTFSILPQRKLVKLSVKPVSIDSDWIK